MAHRWLRRWASLGAAVVLLAGLLAPASVQRADAQTTINVTTTAEAPGAAGDCTLGEAIQAANTFSAIDACPAGTGNDLIVLASGATYTLTTPTAADNSAYAINGTLTLQGNGARLAHDPLGGALRFFTMTALSHLTLVNLSLMGGVAQGRDGKSATMIVTAGPGGDASGGALYSLGGALVLNGVTFDDNRALGGWGGAGRSGMDSSNGGNGGEAHGGAIYSLGPVTLTGAATRFTNNQAWGGRGGDGGTLAARGGYGGSAGGGAMSLSGVLDASGAPSSLDHNLAQGGDLGDGREGFPGSANGGALALGGDAVLTGALLANNRAQGGNIGSGPTSGGSAVGGGADGGAIFSGQQLTLVNSRLVSNTAQGGAGLSGGSGVGGGVEILFGDLTLRHTLLLSNTAAGGPASDPAWPGGNAIGGGLDHYTGHASLDQAALIGNVARVGANAGNTTAQSVAGGLRVAQVSADITNTTFALNRADVGGGLSGDSSGVTLTHVTFYLNLTATGSALDGAFQFVVVLRNSLVAYNSGGNCAATVNVAGANLQYPGSTCGAATVADPLLLGVADHGGQTLTAAFGAGSPALDAADPAYCQPTDQRGLRRPVGAGCDLGAYERWLDLFLPLVRR